MARPRRRAPSVQVVTEQVTEESGEEFAEPPVGEASFFDGMSDDSYVMIWRRDDITKKQVYHGKLSPTEATEENVLALYGGGEFLAREKRRMQDGRMVFGKQRSFVLAGAYKNPALHPTPTATTAPVAAPDGVVGVTAQGNVNMEDIKMAGVLSLLQMTQQAAQAQSTMQSQMQQLLISTMTAQRESMEAIVKAATTRPAEAPRESPLEMIKTVMEMVKGTQSPKSEVKDLIEGMKSIMDFREDLSPPKEGSGNVVMDSIPKMLDLVKEGFALKKVEQEAHAMPTAPKTSAQIPAASEVPNDAPIWQKVLLAQRRSLIGAASSGKNPEVVAMAAVEFMPEAIRGAMEEFVRRPDVMVQMVAVVPELQQFPHWLEQFTLAAREQLLTDEELAALGGEGATVEDAANGDPEE